MSSEEEEDFEDGKIFTNDKPQKPSALDSQPVAKVPMSSTKKDIEWIISFHQNFLKDVKERGIEACEWRTVLEKWQQFIADTPFEHITIRGVRMILKLARLTPIAQPTYYETLRKLGKDILFVESDKNTDGRALLNRLLMKQKQDGENFSYYFGSQEQWLSDPKSLVNHLDKLHGQKSSTLSQELTKEKILGFMVPHIRSNRYHHVELGAILLHLVGEIPTDMARPWAELAKSLQENDLSVDEQHVTEAQSFILHCFENIYRARQSLEGSEKRNGAVGVILFCDVSAGEGCGNMAFSTLDKWYDENCEKSQNALEKSQNALETCTLCEMKAMIDEEQNYWKTWKTKLKERKGQDFKIADQPLFTMLTQNKLSSSSLLTNLINSIKSYAEKKKNLRELAAKSSKKECVIQAIKDLNNDSLNASRDAPCGRRKIAVFGYTLNNEQKGVPEASEQSVIVRSVPLTKKSVGDESNTLEKLDAHVFEIGISLSGSYLNFNPKDSEELYDMLTTSGLGLSKADILHFFKYIPHGEHSPRSRSIDEILEPVFTSSDDKDVYSHVLLTIPDTLGRQSTAAYADIADAGGRFLIDMKKVGSCRTEGMRYHPLAVEAAASVANGGDGKARAFRRLAVLLPPSMPNEMPNNYELHQLGKEAERGKGYQESAEIIAEVLSLVAIDQSKIDDISGSSTYRTLVKKHLEGNPLLLYYTSIDLLNTVGTIFARIIAEYWEEKLGLGQNNYAAELSIDEQESRKIVLELITSGVPRGLASQSDSAHRQNGKAAGMATVANGEQLHQAGRVAGKSIALATESHLRLLPNIIQKETHFAQEEIFVEESNFESVLLRLKRACPTSLTFTFVYITGRISADQINQLVTVPAPAIKLIFRYSQSLVSLLDLSPSIRSKIYRPDSITDALAGKMRPVNYTEKSAVGAMVMHTLDHLSQFPEHNFKAGLYWDNEYPEAFVRQAVEWREDIMTWAHSEFNDDTAPTEFCRILITADHLATARDLAVKLSSGDQALIARVVDAGDRAKFDEIKSFIDYRTTPSFSYASGKSVVAMAKTEESTANQTLPHRAVEILILCRAAFLPHTRLEVLMSRCYSKKAKLLLLCNEPTSNISHFRVFKDIASPPTWVRVPTIVQREFRDRTKLRGFLAFTGLQLLFSHEVFALTDHYKQLERSLESWAQDGCQLEFLNQVDGLPTDPTIRAMIVSTLANVDDVADGHETTTKKCFVEILCIHINRYLRFPAEASHPIVSFSDFCHQPRARFLSQIHRVEAYMCYIYSRTDQEKRLASLANHSWPLGVPLGTCLVGILQNIHVASHPGALMTAIFEKDISSPELMPISLPQAQYIDPGRGDVVTHVQEISEHRAIVGAELHWEEMFAKWETGPEIADDVLDHILVHSPSRLSVILSMTPSHIVNLSLSKLALKAISEDFQNCEDLIRQVSPESSRSLRTRGAAIWWLLLLKNQYSNQINDQIFSQDQSLLLESGIYIEPKGTAGDVESGDTYENLLFRVTSAMLPMDTMDTFLSQHAIREYILSDSQAISRLLDNPDIKIGRAFVTACVARETLTAIMKGQKGQKIFEKMGHILKWVRDSSTSDEGMIRQDMKNFAPRFTPRAIASILLSCNPPYDFVKARDAILEPCICHAEQLHETDGAKTFLSDILKALCDNRGLAVELFEVLARPASQNQVDFPIPDLSDFSESWNAMYVAMKDPESAKEFYNLAKQDNFQVPFEVSERLCELYVKVYCAEGRDVLNDLEHHALLLQTDVQRNAVYKYLTSNPMRNINRSILCLLWFTWWSRASASFPIQYRPTPETWELFQTVTRKVGVHEEKVAEGLSTIARFAIAPHTLPASTLNALKFAMVSPQPAVVSETTVLAQSGSTTYPVYGFRTHNRRLPRECIKSLVDEVKRQELSGFSATDIKETWKMLFPITDSGVSKNLVQRNLNILVHINQSPSSNEEDKTAQMRAQIFLPTLAWFFSAGFTLTDLKDMLSERQREMFGKNYIIMVSVWKHSDFPKALVYCPLPVYVDVRFVCGKTGCLFQLNQESASLTVQWLAMLELQFNLLDFTEPEEFQKYAAERSKGKHVDPEIPKTIVRSTMRKIGKSIVQKHNAVKLGGSESESFHVVFVLDGSGSMSSDWLNLIRAVGSFLETRLLIGAEDLVSLITFNSSPALLCERKPIQKCYQELSSLLQSPSGGTQFGPALKNACEVLIRGREAGVRVRPFLFFMSDGEANTPTDGDAEMQEIVREFGTQIQTRTLAFGGQAGTAKLRHLAQLAGGEFLAARDGAEMKKRFADTAHGLAKSKATSKQDTDHAQDWTEAQKAQHCAAVIDTCVPLADFFAQLRNGAQSLSKHAFEGLSEGLLHSKASQDLQVYVADALYMLIGVTPVNSGVEVMYMLENWREKGLTVGSSVVMEINFMAKHVYEARGLSDLGQKLLNQIEATDPHLKRVPYVRSPANKPLSNAVVEPDKALDIDIYSFNDMPRIYFPGREFVKSRQNSEHPAIVAQSNAAPRAADFDHAREIQSKFRTPIRAKNIAVPTTVAGPREDSVRPKEDVLLFRCATSDMGFVNAQKGSLPRRLGRGFVVGPRTISARDLVHVDTGAKNIVFSGYAIVRIVPGLHPVLRTPGDSENIPVSQQKSLGRGRDSFDREDQGKKCQKIEAIFSNNGGTWANLSLLPAGSTIMGRGFYMRKSNEGWVFLVGANTESSLEHPPLVLWSILDNMKLAALDFTDLVIDTLRALVCLAYDPINTKESLEPANFKSILDQIRSWSFAANRTHDPNAEKYSEYIKRERIICQHLLQVLQAIHEDTRGSTMWIAFQADELERKLGQPVHAIEDGVSQIIFSLSQFIGTRDWVPRSQLTFTLEFALANHPGHSHELNPRNALRESHSGSDSPTDIEAIPESEALEEGESQEGNDLLSPLAENDDNANTSFVKNKLIAAHEHVTQYKFRQMSLQIIRDIERRKKSRNRLDWTKMFADSDDDEDEDHIPLNHEEARFGVEEDAVVDDAHRQRGIGDMRSHAIQYEDDALDMPLTSAVATNFIAKPIFPDEWGYGHPICSQFCVPSVTGEHVPLYFVVVDVRKLKIQYSDADGLPIAFLFHKRLLDKSLKHFRAKEEEKKKAKDSLEVDEEVTKEEKALSSEDLMLAYREQLLQWLTDLIRSPLPTAAKDWFLDKLENGATTRCVPSLSSNESVNDVGGDLNLVVIAHCIATALPTPNECRHLFRTAFHIPKGFSQFCKRKNDLYGVHIVRGGTLQELLDYGAVVEVCNLGYDALTRSKDNASMYLSIIGKFQAFTWLVYVTGLDHIDDALLKWLAEYTRVHPWRFVYLENTQTSWNFSENRDRCIYDRAPAPVERSIRSSNDLKKGEISQLRPTHMQPYPRVVRHCELLKTTEQKVNGECDWEEISTFTRRFFRNTAAQFSSASTSPEGDWTVSADWECGSDYRETVKTIFDTKDACVVLLCSPPGAGKSFFSNQLAEMLKRKHSIGRAFIDGSDDRLVDMALTEVLDVELPDPTKHQFLVVDEFHMLKDHHKQDLFSWLLEHARRLHVLLIANRKDANDVKHLDELIKKGSAIGLQPGRVRHFSTRLGNALLDEVMQDRKTDQKRQGQIRRWMHCCRCLFGGEAVSLRNIPGLEEKLKKIDNRTGTADELVNLLLDKVPTISEATAKEFVAAYLASFEASIGNDFPSNPIPAIVQKVKSLVSTMVQSALLTEDNDDVGMDFPDFVSFGLERAYDAPPSLRIAAWCCHIRFVVKKSDKLGCMDPPKFLFQSMLVDQCGFPLQLEEQGPAILSEGLAFSWGGDYSRMQDIIDAVRHGHSVDWTDVHERCWKCEPVHDSRLLVELLSVCTSPSKVLNALTKDNLCSLLKKSNPDDTLSIASDILKYQTYLSSAKGDRFLSPYRTSLWMVICYDKSLSEPFDILNQIGPADPESSEAEAGAIDWREDELVDGLIWASTHMMDMVTCRPDDDPRLRTAFLKSTLQYASERLVATGDYARASRLWSGMFAPLLLIPPSALERTKEMDIAVHVAINAEDCNSKWCSPLRLLWSVAHGRGTAAQVNELWTHYRQLLLVDGQASSPVHQRLAGGILCVTGVIPLDLQIAILTRGGNVDLEMVGERVESAMELLRGAIEAIVKDDEGRLRMADGTFRQYVLQEAKQFRDEEEA